MEMYLVGESVKKCMPDGTLGTNIIVYGKGYRSLDKSRVTELPYERLILSAKEHKCSVSEAYKFHIDQRNMWNTKKGALQFIERFSRARPNLNLIVVEW